MSSFADRVKETSTSTSTGDFTLAGAATGFQTVNAGIGQNVNVEYTIEAVDSNGAPTGDWEVGDGYMSDATTLKRAQVRASSNSGALVNFSAGTKNVWVTFPAHRARASNRGWSLQFGLP